MRYLILAAIAAINIVWPVQAQANPIVSTVLRLGGGAAVALGVTADLLTVFGGLGGSTNKLNMTVNGDQYNFFLTIVGGAVLSDADLEFSGAALGPVTTPTGGTVTAPFWLFDFRIGFDDKGFLGVNDSMSVNGFVQHAIGPDTGDADFGPQLHYNLAFNADNAKYPPNPILGCGNPGTFGDVGNDQVKDGKHPGIPHWDTLSKVDLSGTANASGIFCEFDDITGFTFQLEAHHTPGKLLPELPEPSSLILIASGLFALGVILRRRYLFGPL